jgi:hypothetical protein
MPPRTDRGRFLANRTSAIPKMRDENAQAGGAPPASRRASRPCFGKVKGGRLLGELPLQRKMEVTRVLSHSIKIAAAFALLLAAALPAPAQEWARKMFKKTSHDFGTVARGAKAEVSFELTNLYKEQLHIASVRSSCGCTTPTFTRDTIPSLETSEIIATFNTKSYTGHRNSTITVVFDKPFYAEVQLNVTGFIRGDLVFEPPSVQFQVDAGMADEKTITVSYAGRPDWKIVDVTSAQNYYEVQLVETERTTKGVKYAMTVKLKDNAPAGFLNDQLMIVPNDQNAVGIPLVVEGKVNASITVTSILSLGELAPGGSVTKNVVIKSKNPCTLTGVKCENCVKVDLPKDAKKVHVVPITFTADPNQHGKVTTKIEFESDLGVLPAVTAVGEVK